jgi:hypothetical protein
MSDDRQKRIERRAYEIWDREGRRSGMDAENWQRAEAEIAREEAEASTAKPAEPEPAAEPIKVEPEPSVTIKPEAKSRTKPEARSRTKAEAKPAEPGAPAQARKSGGKAKASADEIQEKSPRKRKAPTKKK